MDAVRLPNSAAACNHRLRAHASALTSPLPPRRPTKLLRHRHAAAKERGPELRAAGEVSSAAPPELRRAASSRARRHRRRAATAVVRAPPLPAPAAVRQLACWALLGLAAALAAFFLLIN